MSSARMTNEVTLSNYTFSRIVEYRYDFDIKMWDHAYGILFGLRGDVDVHVRMTGFSFKTVTRFLGMFRHLVTTSLEFEGTTIGGLGALWGRRNQTRETEVQPWTQGWGRLGNRWRCTPQRSVSLFPVVDRSQIRFGIIFGHMSPGSIVHTDGWRYYIGIDVACSVTHRVVNHASVSSI
jgi:hypothetical protein